MSWDHDVLQVCKVRARKANADLLFGDVEVCLCWKIFSSALWVATWKLFEVIGLWESFQCLLCRTGLFPTWTNVGLSWYWWSRWQCVIWLLWFCCCLQLGSVGGTLWELRAFVWQELPAQLVAHAFACSEARLWHAGLGPRLLSHSLLLAVLVSALQGSWWEYFFCLSRALFALHVSSVDPDGILAGVSLMHPMEMEDRTLN